MLLKAFGDNEAALNYYKKVKDENHFENIYLNMSEIYIEQNKYDAAIEILNEGIGI